MKIIALIPARGGSKGVVGKNLKKLAGKPLIGHTIKFAKECGVFDRIIVSSDDHKICEYAIDQGIEVIVRPEELAQDNSLVIDAIRYTLNELHKEGGYSPDIIFLLEPTSPFRDTEDVLKAIKVINEGYDCAATYCETEPPPGRIWKIENDMVSSYIKDAMPFLPRQQQAAGYKLTGQIYAFKKSVIENESSISILNGKIYPLITNADRVIDIDTELDFLIAEQIIIYNEKTS